MVSFNAILISFFPSFQRLNWYAKLNGFGQRFNKESIDCMASVDGDISSLDQKQPFTLSLQVPGVAPTDGISSKLIAFEYHIDVSESFFCFFKNKGDSLVFAGDS